MLEKHQRQSIAEKSTAQTMIRVLNEASRWQIHRFFPVTIETTITVSRSTIPAERLQAGLELPNHKLLLATVEDEF